MNKPVYLGLIILDLSNTIMNEFCYDCVKPKYGKNAKLRYNDTDRFHCPCKNRWYLQKNCRKW